MLVTTQGNWQTYRDKTSDKLYFFNTVTNATVWDRPSELDKLETKSTKPPPASRPKLHGGSMGSSSELVVGPVFTIDELADAGVPGKCEGQEDIATGPSARRPPPARRTTIAGRPPPARKMTVLSIQAGRAEGGSKSVTRSSVIQKQDSSRDVFPALSKSSDAQLADTWKHKLRLNSSMAKEQEHFLTRAFRAVEDILDAVIDSPTMEAHPLMTMLLESTQTMRETLNCWSEARLHAVAIESIRGRLNKSGAIIKKAVATVRPHLTTSLLHKGKWRMWSATLNKLTNSSKHTHVYDMESITKVDSIHTGKGAEFVVCFGNQEDMKFEAKNDTTKQRWMTLFLMYFQRSYISRCLHNLSPCQRTGLYRTAIYHDYNPLAEQGREVDFLFATTNTSMKELEVHGGASKSEESTFGLRERFKVLWPQTLKKGKHCELELALSTPPRFSFYEPVKGSSGPMQVAPSFMYTSNELVDFKADRKKKEIEFFFTSGLHEEGTQKSFKRKLVFDNEANVLGCLNSLRAFRTPPAELTFRLLYQDLMHAIDRKQVLSKEDDKFIVEQDTAGPIAEDPASSGMFKGHLHSLISAMEKLSPSNKHCQELHTRSLALPMDSTGDLERIRMLVHKLCARFVDGKLERDLCCCSSNTCLLLCFRALERAQGINDFARFTRMSQSSEVRGWALRGVWFALRSHEVMDNCTTSLEDVEVGGWTAPLLPFNQYVTLAHSREPLQLLCVNALFEILIEEPPNFDDACVIEEVSTMNKIIKKPFIVPLVMNALAHASTEACKVGLQHFVLLLQNTTNSSPFLSQPGWQLWLFPVLALHFAEGQEHTECFTLALGLFTQLHYQALVIAKESASMSGKDTYRFKSHVVYASLRGLRRMRGWTQQTVKLANRVLSSLIQSLTSHGLTFANNLNPASGAYPLVLDLFAVLIEYLYFMPLVEQTERVDSLQGSDHLTPLMLAAQKGNMEMAKHLVDNMGASTEVTDNQGRTAEHLAHEEGHTELAVYLQQAALKVTSKVTVAGLHVTDTGKAADLPLLLKSIKLMEALHLNERREETFISFGEKPDATVKALIKTSKMWWDFLIQLKTDLQSWDSLDKNNRGQLQIDMSKRLTEQQKWQKSGRSARDCNLSVNLGSIAVSPKRRARKSFFGGPRPG